MLVTVWRHGEAGSAPTDEARALTDRGSDTVASAAQDYQQQLAEAGLAPPTVCRYSPLVRTRQTAELLSCAWALDASPCDALAPGTAIHAPGTFLVDNIAHQVIVSHQPFVSQLIWYWLDDDRLEPLLPGGWATLELTAATRGGGTLRLARTSIFA